jgi:hypothetical protein
LGKEGTDTPDFLLKKETAKDYKRLNIIPKPIA